MSARQATRQSNRQDESPAAGGWTRPPRTFALLTWSWGALGFIAQVSWLALLVWLLVSAVSWLLRDYAPNPMPWAAVVLGLVGLGYGGLSLREFRRLTQGGVSLALGCGARRADAEPIDAVRTRLLHVTEEVAAAARLPVPQVWFLPHPRDFEQGINAFAAGWAVDDAVLVVSEGALDRLSRDELRSVIAHEMAHALHGDLTANLIAVGWVRSLHWPARWGWRSLRVAQQIDHDPRSVYRAWTPLAWCVTMLVFLFGWPGVLVAHGLQAFLARRQEFDADSAATRMLRDVNSLAAALRKVQGLARLRGDRIDLRGYTEAASHLCLVPPQGRGGSLWNGSRATHPALTQRIRRLMGGDAQAIDASEMAAEFDPGEEARLHRSEMSRLTGDTLVQDTLRRHEAANSYVDPWVLPHPVPFEVAAAADSERAVASLARALLVATSSSNLSLSHAPALPWMHGTGLSAYLLQRLTGLPLSAKVVLAHRCGQTLASMQGDAAYKAWGKLDRFIGRGAVLLDEADAPEATDDGQGALTQMVAGTPLPSPMQWALEALLAGPRWVEHQTDLDSVAAVRQALVFMVRLAGVAPEDAVRVTVNALQTGGFTRPTGKVLAIRDRDGWNRMLGALQRLDETQRVGLLASLAVVGELIRQGDERREDLLLTAQLAVCRALRLEPPAQVALWLQDHEARVRLRGQDLMF